MGIGETVSGGSVGALVSAGAAVPGTILSAGRELRMVPAVCENKSLGCRFYPVYVVRLRRAMESPIVWVRPRALCQSCTEALLWLHGPHSRSGFRVGDVGRLIEWDY